MSIQSEIERINNAKTEIAEAISEKGVPVAEGTSIDNLPGLIRNIPQEGGESVEEIFWITCDLDSNTFTAGNISHTYDEIKQALASNKVVKVKGLIDGMQAEYLIADCIYVGGLSGYIIFGAFVRTVISGSVILMYMNMRIFADGHIRTETCIINTTAIGG